VIKHEIRNKDGGTSEVSQTPIKAIRHHCIECMGFVTSEVKGCTSPLCSLFPYRLGKAPGHRGKGMVCNLN
jgi:hypothetical protein